ncbi:MAG: monofunctional biosynthetic peptidoglycan transglycosylase [Zoogloeaceae bacterium]|jgi:monofunctional biosynthetic peptidoglycan transglycosylase|nr:monofunctional biosynthetic peptidoglycan transglycosylase [Zoogloeaceae bacterium]
MKPRFTSGHATPKRRGVLFHCFKSLQWALTFAVLIFLLVQLWFFGWLLWWKWTPPQETHFMSIRLAELREQNPDARLDYQWVDYNQISDNLKRALIAAEDARFVDHEGFDWDGIQVALQKNQKTGHFVAGGSTISQQLAKNLFLNPHRSMLRKGQEALITLMIEALWDKERIFECYLNVIEWGNGVFGAEAASRHYYRVSANQLSTWQAARLAAMAPNPRYYDTHRKASGLARKTAIIHSRMGAAQLPVQRTED